MTHLFNGMPPIHHRDPGPALGALAAARDGAVLELIADGVHLADATVAGVLALVGGRAVVFVTDAMAAAGMADGDYVLGPQAVQVRDGVARLAEGSSIAGGTSRLLDVVRRQVACRSPRRRRGRVRVGPSGRRPRARPRARLAGPRTPRRPGRHRRRPPPPARDAGRGVGRMILTVTCNPAVDVTYDVDRLVPGAVHRVSRVRQRLGGKGVNVARVLHQLGEPVHALGLGDAGFARAAHRERRARDVRRRDARGPSHAGRAGRRDHLAVGAGPAVAARRG